jgi:phosphohistidine phosphatase
MKTLYLVRHAKSSWKRKDLPDFDRPLNKRGRRDAPMMGALLHDRGVDPDLLVTSPAVRAMQTARIIAARLEIPEEKIVTIEEIYGAYASTLAGIIANFDVKIGSALICGHNPGLTHLLETYTGAGIDNMPTCAAAAIEFDAASWHATKHTTGALIWFEWPKKVGT